jgi:hypothetical protein
MYAQRIRPQLEKTTPLKNPAAGGDQPLGCFWSAIIILIAYFFINAIVRVTSNSGSKFDQVICYGALICLVVIIILGIRDTLRESRAQQTARLNWAASCKTAQLTIASRQEAVSWWDDYTNRYHNLPNYLELDMNSGQIAASPTQPTVRVDVDRDVYNRLKDSSTVRIYYQPETPLTFLLEEEL